MKARLLSANNPLAEINSRHSDLIPATRQSLAGGNPLGYRHRQTVIKEVQPIPASQ
jgi:hypothetical protein